MKFLFFFICFTTSVFAQYENAREEVLNPDNEFKFKEKDINKRSEKYKIDEALVFVPDKNLGVGGETRFTLLDRNRFSIAYEMNHDYEKFGDVQSFDLSYHRRADSYSKMWWGAHVYSTKAKDRAILGEPLSYKSKNSEGLIERDPTNTVEILGYGFGAGYRYKYFLDFLKIEKDIFEYVFVYFDKNNMFDEVTKKFYSGYGATMSYGIQHRIRTQFYWGGGLTYHLASVIRDPIGHEAKAERTLNLGWTTLGFEIGYFF